MSTRQMALLYKNTYLYHGLINFVYGVSRKERFHAVVRWVPDDMEVLDVCCGDGTLASYLARGVNYRGLDQSPVFVREAQALGRSVELFDVRMGDLPSADVVVCQVSLFQFYPQAESMLARLLDAAKYRLVISESVFSLSQSHWSWLATIVGRGTKTKGKSTHTFRYTSSSLRQLYQPYPANLRHAAEVCNGREWVYVLDKSPIVP
ncbi:MAG: class I SAM-dependent methyltransferase [Gammaproteobacteria bacterium]